MNDVEFEGFGVIFALHKAFDDALEQVFVNTSGGNMVDDGFHALHEIKCLVTLDALSNCSGEIFAIVILFNSGRKEIYVSRIDKLRSTSSSFVDCGDYNVKNPCSDLFGFFTLSKQHSHVKDSTEIE